MPFRLYGVFKFRKEIDNTIKKANSVQKEPLINNLTIYALIKIISTFLLFSSAFKKSNKKVKYKSKYEN